jgi:hypothetical protein
MASAEVTEATNADGGCEEDNEVGAATRRPNKRFLVALTTVVAA